jgi:hypothetical protein
VTPQLVQLLLRGHLALRLLLLNGDWALLDRMRMASLA